MIIFILKSGMVLIYSLNIWNILNTPTIEPEKCHYKQGTFTAQSSECLEGLGYWQDTHSADEWLNGNPHAQDLRVQPATTSESKLVAVVSHGWGVGYWAIPRGEKEHTWQ